MEEFEKKLQIVNDGKMSQIAYSYFSESVKNRQKFLLDEIKQAYRSRHCTNDFMLSRIAAITEYDDLLKTLEKQIRNARVEHNDIVSRGDL